VAAVLIVSAIFAGDLVHTLRAEKINNLATAAPQQLPANIGTWRRVRTWNDTLLSGWIIYTWAEYAPADPSQPHVSLGISPRLGVHDTQVCHLARGEEPVWQGPLTDASPSGEVTLNAAVYNNGRVQRLEAATVCQGAACHEFAQTTQHVTFVVAPPEGRLPLQNTTGPVPILLKVESRDTTSPVSTVLPGLTASLASFLREADLAAIASPYSHRK
jgi:exosortase J